MKKEILITQKQAGQLEVLYTKLMNVLDMHNVTKGMHISIFNQLRKKEVRCETVQS
jgi:hypothetical protein